MKFSWLCNKVSKILFTYKFTTVCYFLTDFLFIFFYLQALAIALKRDKVVHIIT